MIFEHANKTFEEALERAEELLWEDRTPGATEQNLSTLRKVGRDTNEPLPFGYVEDEDTGAMACLVAFGEERQNICYLTAKEADPKNRTYIFNGVLKYSLPVLAALRVNFFRPVEAIPLDEAFTPQGVKKVNAFYGYDGYGDLIDKAQLLEGKFTLATAFYYFGEEISQEEIVELENNGEDIDRELACNPFPCILEEVTGLKVKNATDYAKALAKYLGAKFTKGQIEFIKGVYNFCAADMLLRYATYEFFRTEDYNRLKEVVGEYQAFGLPKDWAAKHAPLNFISPNGISSTTAEEYVLAKYCGARGAEIVGGKNNLREIANYTHTPLKVIMKAARNRYIWD